MTSVSGSTAVVITVTDERLPALRAALKAGMVPDGDKSLGYEFRRGWNDGVEFASNQVDKIFGKEETAA